jgi:hypothetical protein
MPVGRLKVVPAGVQKGFKVRSAPMLHTTGVLSSGKDWLLVRNNHFFRPTRMPKELDRRGFMKSARSDMIHA